MLVEHDIHVIATGVCYGTDLRSRGVLDAQYKTLHEYAHIQPSALQLSSEELSLVRRKLGISWSDAQVQYTVINAATAMTSLDISPLDLANIINNSAKAIHFRVRKGLHITKLDRDSTVSTPLEGKVLKSMIIINAFYPGLREHYYADDFSTTYMLIEWDVKKMDWSELHLNVLGNDNPALALSDSIRGRIYSNWTRLRLQSEPSRSDNVLHCSASAFEGTVDRLLWVKGSMLFTDLFGSRLMTARFHSAYIKQWLANPVVSFNGQDQLLLELLHYKSSSGCIVILKQLEDICNQRNDS